MTARPLADWRPATFRGVAFSFAEAPEYGGGRKVADHEIFDGEPFTEDTGADFDTFSFAAQIIGPEYRDQADALESALRQRGPGTLVHPTRGTLSVQITSWSAVVVYQKVTYKVECKLSGAPVAPGEAPQTTVRKWTDALRDRLATAFQAAFSTLNQTAEVVSSAIADVNDAADAVLTAAKQYASPDIVGSMLAQAEMLAGTADSTVRAPADLAAQWGELIGPLAEASREASLAALAAVAPPLASPGSPIEANSAALSSLVRGQLASALCDATVADLPPTREDAEAARDATLAALATVAGEATDADSWRAIMDARDNTARIVSRLVLTLPRTRTWMPPQAVSVFEAAGRLGADVDDLVDRNGIVCSLWLTEPVRYVVT